MRTLTAIVSVLTVFTMTGASLAFDKWGDANKPINLVDNKCPKPKAMCGGSGIPAPLTYEDFKGQVEFIDELTPNTTKPENIFPKPSGKEPIKSPSYIDQTMSAGA